MNEHIDKYLYDLSICIYIYIRMYGLARITLAVLAGVAGHCFRPFGLDAPSDPCEQDTTKAIIEQRL